MNVRFVLPLVLAIAAPTVAWSQIIWVPGLLIEKASVRIDPTATVPLATLDRGTDVTVVAVKNDWLEIAFEDQRYGRRVGYVPRSTVSFVMPGARSAARSEPATSAPVPVAAPATARPIDARAAVAGPSAAPAVTSAPLVVASAPLAVATTVPTVPSAEPPAAPRPPVRMVESEFPSATRAVSAAAQAEPTQSSTPAARSAIRTVESEFPSATRSASAAAPAESSQASASAVRPPVRTVEHEFPSAARSASAATSVEPSPAARAVVSIGDAFPEAARSPLSEFLPAPTASFVVSEPSERVVQPSTTAAGHSGENPASSSSSSATATVAVNSARPTPATMPIDAGTVRGGRASVTPKRGMPVTLMIPRALLKDDGTLALRKVPIVAADITGAEGEGASVNGVKEWMRAGLPSLLEASVKKVTRNRDHTELELRASDVKGAEVVVKLRFAHSLPDPTATLGELVVEGGPDTPAALKYRKEAYAAVAGAVFAGDLNGLSEERKLSILATLQRSVGSPDVHLHDGRVHASFDLGVDPTIFNDRTADDATIVSQVLNETVLPQVREMAKSLEDVPELHGMRVLYRIPHKAKLSATTKEYRVELVAGMGDVVKFAKTELTNQEFLDASQVVVDGEAVRVAMIEPQIAVAGH